MLPSWKTFQLSPAPEDSQLHSDFLPKAPEVDEKFISFLNMTELMLKDNNKEQIGAVAVCNKKFEIP